MTQEQSAELLREVKRQGHFTLSLYRSMFGENADIVADYMEGRIPEPWKSEVRDRLDRISVVEYHLAKMQAQLDRIEAKLSQ